MKKLFNYAMLGAIALAGATGLTACSSSDDAVVEKNPTYDPATNSVTTQFVLNVSSATNGTTRQSADIVQKNSNFRGLQDAKLVALSTGHSAYVAPYDGEATTGFAVNKTFDLGTLYGSSACCSRYILRLHTCLTLQPPTMLKPMHSVWPMN